MIRGVVSTVIKSCWPFWFSPLSSCYHQPFCVLLNLFTIPPFRDQTIIFQFFFLPRFHPLSSLHLPIAVRLSRPTALDLASSDPLTLVSLDLGGCNLLQYHQCTVCLYLAPNHVIWCKIMQPLESPWITANKWESGQTNRTHLQLSKYKMLFWALY